MGLAHDSSDKNTSVAGGFDFATLAGLAVLIWLTSSLILFTHFHLYFASPAEISARWAVADGFVWVVVAALSYGTYRLLMQKALAVWHYALIIAAAVLLSVVGHPLLSILMHWVIEGELGRGFLDDARHLILKRLPQGIAIGTAIGLTAIASLKRLSIRHAPTMSHYGFQDGLTHYRVPIAEIEYLEAAGNYVAIHHNGEAPLARISLSAILKTFSKKDFVQISRKHAANLAHISKLRKKDARSFELVLLTGTVLPVSRSRAATVKRTIAQAP